MSINLNVKSFLKNKKIKIIDSEIISSSNLSVSFGCTCEKIYLKNGKKFVVKIQNELNAKQYKSIYYEGKSLEIMNKKFSSLFPRILHIEKEFFIMSWIKNNGESNLYTEKDFANKLSNMHAVKGEMFGYDFNTPIGGIEQNCDYEKSWTNFYKTKRLQMIYDLINRKNPMSSKINNGIEKIINNIEKYIPESNRPSLIHGDLWGGNILYNNGKLAGLIDPAIQYADIEFELSYLKFFNTVSDTFFDYYNNNVKIDKGFNERSGIYELYHALLNVHLWDRSYINIVNKILERYI